MSATGTLTWSNFVDGCRFIYNVSESIGDGWQWRGEWDEFGGGFLAKKFTVAITPSDAGAGIMSVDSSDQRDLSDEDSEDSACITGVDFLGHHFREFHVLYGQAYAVPVLYVRAVRQNGSYLGFESLWKDFTQNSSADAESFKRVETLTQQEHPILGEPWYFLHPCSTATLMRNFTTSPLEKQHERYLVTWMSTTLSLFSCPLSHLYAVHLTEK